MGVDKMGVDKMGVDEMGVDEMGVNHPITYFYSITVFNCYISELLEYST